MQKFKSFNEYKETSDTKKLTESVYNLFEGQLEYEEINELFGIGKLFKSLFVNPGVKRKIKKLIQELIKVRVEMAKLSLEYEPEEFEEEYGDEDEDDKPKPTREMSPNEVRSSALKDEEEAIIAKMELLAGEDERLTKFVEMQKIEAKLKASELIYKIASDEQQKILKKYNKDVSKEIKNINKELKDIEKDLTDE